MKSWIRCLLLSIAVFTPLALRSACGQDVLDGIAAVVNNDVITFHQVRELVAAKEKAAHQQYQGEALAEKIKEIRLQAVNDLIDRQLIIDEFRNMEKKGAKIPDHIIDEHIDTIIREDFGGDRAAFIRTLAAEGYTIDRFREQEMDKIIVQAMRGQLVKTSSVIPEPKILEIYKQNIEQYTSEEQMKLRMLVIRKGDGEDRRKMVDEIRQKIVGGAAFEDLARMYSEDNSTQEAGGDWGWINRRTLNESLTKVAFSLKPGEVSKVVELNGSYYLLFCEAHKPAVTKSFAEVRKDIESNLIQEERQKAQELWLAKLRSKAYIKIY